MKQLFYLPLLCILVFNKASAQNSNNRYDLNINDAGKHIGEYKMVNGVLYKVEIRHDKANPDSASVLFYLHDTKHPSSYLINIFRVNIKGNTPQANWFRNIKPGEVKPSKVIPDDYDAAAEGKIFIFEGKPAIRTKFEDMIILEKVS